MTPLHLRRRLRGLIDRVIPWHSIDPDEDPNTLSKHSIDRDESPDELSEALDKGFLAWRERLRREQPVTLDALFPWRRTASTFSVEDIDEWLDGKGHLRLYRDRGDTWWYVHGDDETDTGIAYEAGAVPPGPLELATALGRPALEILEEMGIGPSTLGVFDADGNRILSPFTEPSEEEVQAHFDGVMDGIDDAEADVTVDDATPPGAALDRREHRFVPDDLDESVVGTGSAHIDEEAIRRIVGEINAKSTDPGECPRCAQEAPESVYRHIEAAQTDDPCLDRATAYDSDSLPTFPEDDESEDAEIIVRKPSEDAVREPSEDGSAGTTELTPNDIPKLVPDYSAHWPLAAPPKEER